MDNTPDDDRAARIRQARQVLAGGDLIPAEDPLGFGDRVAPSRELLYFAVLAVLVLLAAIIGVVIGPIPASIVLFILALSLLAGWFIL